MLLAMDGTNPWLAVPAVEYEAHMAAPHVAQTQVLSALFGEACRRVKPGALAVLGCTTGNGFEHIDPAVTTRCLGVDLNPAFLELAGERFGAALPGLELIELDLSSEPLPAGDFDLIWAGLIFEYVDPAVLLATLSDALARVGTLLTVLQRPVASGAKVSKTDYESLKRLEPVITLVEPAALIRLAADHGLVLGESNELELPGGKRFAVLEFRRNPHPS